MVKRYTTVFGGPSWLLNEETMTEFGYKHTDPEAGIFMSRMTLEELREIDLAYAAGNGELKLNSVVNEGTCKLSNEHTPYTDPFLFEFFIHLNRRCENLEDVEATDDPEEKKKLNSNAYAENLLLEKYFGNTLRHSEMGWSDEKVKHQQEKASLWKRS